MKAIQDEQQNQTTPTNVNYIKKRPAQKTKLHNKIAIEK